MKHDGVSKIWAAAIFETALETNVLSEVQTEFKTFVETISASRESSRLFSEYGFGIKEKSAVMEKILEKGNYSRLFKRFISMLVGKGRSHIISNIYEEFILLNDQHNGIIKGVVVAAVAEDKSVKADIEKKLSDSLKKKIELLWHIDQSILGGLIVNIAGKTLDNSIKTQLSRLKEKLKGERL